MTFVRETPRETRAVSGAHADHCAHGGFVHRPMLAPVLVAYDWRTDRPKRSSVPKRWLHPTWTETWRYGPRWGACSLDDGAAEGYVAA